MRVEAHHTLEQLQVHARSEQRPTVALRIRLVIWALQSAVRRRLPNSAIYRCGGFKTGFVATIGKGWRDSRTDQDGGVNHPFPLQNKPA